MPQVRITLFKGRTHEQKAQMAREITEVIVRVATAIPDLTEVTFEEVDPENYAVGGTLWTDRGM